MAHIDVVGKPWRSLGYFPASLKESNGEPKKDANITRRANESWDDLAHTAEHAGYWRCVGLVRPGEHRLDAHLWNCSLVQTNESMPRPVKEGVEGTRIAF